MATFICPNCGKTAVGPAEWKQWCACGPLVKVAPGHLKREIVEMVTESAPMTFKRPDRGASPSRASSVALDQRIASDPAT